MATAPMRDRQRGIMASERGGIVGPRRVLVVDDDPSVLACYRRVLCRAGYTTVTEDDPRSPSARAVREFVEKLVPEIAGDDSKSWLQRIRT